MHLEPSFNLSILVETPPAVIGDTDQGELVVVSVLGGAATGDIQGEVLRGGGDWLLGDGRYARPDIRMTLRTHDGVDILMRGHGLFELNDAANAAMSGAKATDYEDHYLRINFTLHTGDIRYRWVNETLFLAEGRMGLAGRAEYRIFRVA